MTVVSEVVFLSGTLHGDFFLHFWQLYVFVFIFIDQSGLSSLFTKTDLLVDGP